MTKKIFCGTLTIEVDIKYKDIIDGGALCFKYMKTIENKIMENYGNIAMILAGLGMIAGALFKISI